MMTKPPPYDSAPTLSATQATASIPPVAVGTSVSSGQYGMSAVDGRPGPPRPLGRPGRLRIVSTRPHPSSTSTSHGPSLAADRAPTTLYSNRRRRDGARWMLGPTRSAPARRATAATAALMPAAAPRAHVGGDPARNSAA